MIPMIQFRQLNDLEMLDNLVKFVSMMTLHHRIWQTSQETFSEVAQIDPSYINWLLSPSGIEDEDLEGDSRVLILTPAAYTLRHQVLGTKVTHRTSVQHAMSCGLSLPTR